MGEKQIRRQRVGLTCLFILLLFSSACGTVDPGEQTLASSQRMPDPVLFGARIHPMLTQDAGCAASQCHGSSDLFPLQSAEALPSDSGIDNPLTLPEPLRSDYFALLSRVDFDNPLASPLFRWSQDELDAHPGGAVLSADQRQDLIEWIQGASL